MANQRISYEQRFQAHKKQQEQYISNEMSSGRYGRVKLNCKDLLSIFHSAIIFVKQKQENHKIEKYAIYM